MMIVSLLPGCFGIFDSGQPAVLTESEVVYIIKGGKFLSLDSNGGVLKEAKVEDLENWAVIAKGTLLNPWLMKGAITLWPAWSFNASQQPIALQTLSIVPVVRTTLPT